jgi:transposase
MGEFKKYNKITYKTRLDLIRMVCQEQMSCAGAAKILEISFSTAKMIVKNFRENGKIFEKK